MTSLRWWPLLLVVPLTLAACGGNEAKTPEPSGTALLAQPNATPYPLATAEPALTQAAPATTPEATPASPQDLEGVFVVPADGSGAPVKLAEDGEVHGWSPDGALIAITTLDPDQSGCNVSSQSCFAEISLSRADGQGQPVSLGSGSSPNWSADGKRLLFYRLIRGPIARPPGPPSIEVTAKEICVADAATGETTVLASLGPAAFFGSPTWSPDESRVLFYFGEPGAPSLYVVKADGSEPPVKLADGSSPSADWSPDSRTIAYSCGDYICIVPADGSGPPRRLVPARNPNWSPDGSRIAVEAGLHPDFEVWLIDPETGQGIILVDGQLPDWIVGSVWFVWSPEGSMILYQAEGSVYVVAPDTSTPPTKLAQGFSAKWSPDGKRVAFWRTVGQSDNSAGVHQLFTVNADGSGLTLLADGVAPSCITHAWSPDSRQIAFSTFECFLI